MDGIPKPGFTNRFFIKFGPCTWTDVFSSWYMTFQKKVPCVRAVLHLFAQFTVFIRLSSRWEEMRCLLNGLKWCTPQVEDNRDVIFVYNRYTLLRVTCFCCKKLHMFVSTNIKYSKTRRFHPSFLTYLVCYQSYAVNVKSVLHRKSSHMELEAPTTTCGIAVSSFSRLVDTVFCKHQSVTLFSWNLEPLTNATRICVLHFYPFETKRYPKTIQADVLEFESLPWELAFAEWIT